MQFFWINLKFKEDKIMLKKFRNNKKVEIENSVAIDFDPYTTERFNELEEEINNLNAMFLGRNRELTNNFRMIQAASF